MTTTVILLNLAMSVPAAAIFVTVALLMPHLWPGNPGGEGRADWRGPSHRHLPCPRIQRTAASIATATNSSAR